MNFGIKSCAFVALGLVCSVARPDGGPQNGHAGQMPAFYDEELFTVNMKEMPHEGPENNPSLNTIYASNDLDEEQDFIPVLDAIQGDGFNPLWQEAQIAFKPGVTPFQLTSDNDIATAEAAGTITVTFTDEVYRCSVIGPKK